MKNSRIFLLFFCFLVIHATACLTIDDAHPPDEGNNSANHDNNSANHDNNSANHDNNSVNHDNNSANHDNNSANHDNNSANHDNNAPEKHPIPFGTLQDYLTIYDGESYRPFFLRGVNLGIAVPGTWAGELAATREDYDRWIARIHQAGFNVIRIYTLHYPRFYEAIRDFNLRHVENPVYVLHGIWLDEVAEPVELMTMTQDFDAGIREVVNAVHGNMEIDARFGRAFGEYTVDISPWVAGWIIGREVEPHEITITNEAADAQTSFHGKAFAIDNVQAADAWFVARLDHLVNYERDTYGTQRPVSISSWPTLDPLTHPTESTESSHEDTEFLDLTKIEIIDAPAGWFATYHAYPYYPDFIVDDPDYGQIEDEQGPNSYLGYLLDLRAHYDGVPLFIGEFGIPTSWGNAHYGASGMNHGGLDEHETGEAVTRMFNNLVESSSAGGAVFAWIDEWWKPSWITDPLDHPVSRRAIWHNTAAPEQNYGLVAFDVAQPDWDAAHLTTVDDDALDSIQMWADAAYFHVRIRWKQRPERDQEWILAFDTYADDRGETIMPDGTEATRRYEFALTIDSQDRAQLYVMESYDLFGIWHGHASPQQLFRSTKSDGGEWNPVRWKNNAARSSDDGVHVFEETVDPIGEIRVRAPGQPASSLDGVLYKGDDIIDIRLPWTLLQVSDPSALMVIDDDRTTSAIETTTTEGIAVGVIINETVLAETDRYKWQSWDSAPQTFEREKASLAIIEKALETLPYYVED